MKGFHNLRFIRLQYGTRAKLFMSSVSVKARVAESFLNEDIGTSECDQEFQAEADIVPEGASHDYV